MLVQILNESTLSNTYNEAKEIPKNFLEIRESFGYSGIFALKIIPEYVKFGPFTGLKTSEYSLKIKHGRFVFSNDKLKFLNWMKHINYAKNVSEQNLLPLQCGDHLYYRSNRNIQKGEELLVYFGKEYDNSSCNVEMNFFPNAENTIKDVFACTFCCLGFSSNVYLIEHRTMCPNQISGEFSIKGMINNLIFCRQ